MSLLWVFIFIKLIGNLLRIELLFMQKYFTVSKELGLVSPRLSYVDPFIAVTSLGKLDIHVGLIRNVGEA